MNNKEVVNRRGQLAMLLAFLEWRPVVGPWQLERFLNAGRAFMPWGHRAASLSHAYLYGIPRDRSRTAEQGLGGPQRAAGSSSSIPGGLSLTSSLIR
jgi:hypothetical protein